MKAVVYSSNGKVLDFELGTSLESLAAWFELNFSGMTGVSCSVYGKNGEQVLDLCM